MARTPSPVVGDGIPGNAFGLSRGGAGGWVASCQLSVYRLSSRFALHRLIVQIDTGLRNSFSLSADSMAGEGAGETRQEGGVFLSGSRGSISRLLGSKPSLLTDERGGLSSGRGAHGAAFSGVWGPLAFCSCHVGSARAARNCRWHRMGPPRLLCPGPSLWPHTWALGLVPRLWKPSKILCHPVGAVPLSSLRPEPPPKCVCI